MIFREETIETEGRSIKAITIENSQNMLVKLLNYGAAIVELLVPDRHGRVENVVLTYEKAADYFNNPSFFGVTIGRTSGRIADGSFCLDGKKHVLEKNFGANHGHGGPKSFSHQVWDYLIDEKEDYITVSFLYTSRDMEEGYPGNLRVKASYTLTEANELFMEYEAFTDQRTLCNLTNHSYFNLSGNCKRKVTEQKLQVLSNYFLELNEKQVPTGRLLEVADTPMDFRQLKLIGEDIDSDYIQLRRTDGYDHPWLLQEQDNQIVMLDEVSGRKMSISTTYPSVVIYSYNRPNQDRLTEGKIGSKYDGICFETQFEPDGINHEHLHKGILDIGERYYHKTIFEFSTI